MYTPISSLRIVRAEAHLKLLDRAWTLEGRRLAPRLRAEAAQRRAQPARPADVALALRRPGQVEPRQPQLDDGLVGRHLEV